MFNVPCHVPHRVCHPSGGGFTPPAPSPTPPGVGIDWLDARDVLNGSNPAGGADVPTWDDLSPAADVFTGNGFGTIKYELAALNSALPTVRFNSSSMSGANDNVSNIPFTFFWVSKLNANGSAAQAILTLGQSGSHDNGLQLLEQNNTPVPTFNLYGGDGTTFGTGFPSDTSWHIWCLQWDGTTIRLWQDGPLVLVTSEALTLALGEPTTLGNGNDFMTNNPQMDVFVFHYFQSILSISDINTLGAWYSGTGTGAPATGLSWVPYAVNPLYAPGMLPNGLWNAADLITGLSGGSSLASWINSNGNGNDPANATMANQPIYNTGGPNGLPFVTFNGVSQQLMLTAISGAVPFTWYGVYKRSTSNAVMSLMGNGTAGPPYAMLEYLDGNAYTADDSGYGVCPANNFAYVLAVAKIESSSVHRIWFNGVEQTVMNGSNPDYGELSIIGGIASSGDICEQAMYPGIAHSDADRVAIQSYLNTKWGPFF